MEVLSRIELSLTMRSNSVFHNDERLDWLESAVSGFTWSQSTATSQVEQANHREIEGRTTFFA